MQVKHRGMCILCEVQAFMHFPRAVNFHSTIARVIHKKQTCFIIIVIQANTCAHCSIHRHHSIILDTFINLIFHKNSKLGVITPPQTQLKCIYTRQYFNPCKNYVHFVCMCCFELVNLPDWKITQSSSNRAYTFYILKINSMHRCIASAHHKVHLFIFSRVIVSLKASPKHKLMLSSYLDVHASLYHQNFL